MNTSSSSTTTGTGTNADGSKGAAALRPRPRARSPPGSLLSLHRSASSMSSASTDLHDKRHALPPHHSLQRPSTAHSTSAVNLSPPGNALTNFSRPQPRQSIDVHMRLQSPPATLRSRQHSQGFFEPSLAHAGPAAVGSLGALSASQIAAQTAMHHIPLSTLVHHHPPHHQQQQQGPSDRRRPSPALPPINVAASRQDRRVASPSTAAAAAQSPPPAHAARIDDRLAAATTAANVAFPRSPLPSPHALTHDQPPVSAPPAPLTSPNPEAKTKESRSKMKLFHKPKSIGITKDKDFDRKNPPLPSPSKGLLRAGFTNASTTSLVDPSSSTAGSVYSSANTSTSTLVPVSTAAGDKEKDKEKHRHHFLSRQKQKLKETTEHRALPLSSASSNSQAVDPSAPQSLYSFTPQSPGFSKSVSGLDLRHGGRALREKKKEEKAAAAATALTPIMSNSSANLLRDDSRPEFIGPSSLDSGSILGPPSNISTSLFAFPTLEQTPTISATAFSSLGNSMGLNGITADDAWPLLKARLLNLFGGEDLRTPIEDFNLLVSVHIRRCIQKRAPVLLIEDLRELLTTGFSSLGQTLRGVPDERLVPKLVDIWQMVHASILPYIQAVFLPLDLEFRGRGAIMSSREAAEFWGGFIAASDTPKVSSSFEEQRPESAGTSTTTTTASKMPSLGEELDVRRISLIVFRDVVLLPRHESLLAIFSRLSLDNMTTLPNSAFSPTRGRGFSNPTASGADRPSTGGSLSPRLSSFNSNNSTAMDGASSPLGGGGGSGGAADYPSRSRATSNTSAGSFGIGIHTHNMSIDSVTTAPALPPSTVDAGMLAAAAYRLQQADPAKVTQTVARMLQCVSVVAGVQTGDLAQGAVERLTRELKYNWLGRGRTGRQRRGWVGVKARGVGSGQAVGVGVGA